MTRTLVCSCNKTMSLEDVVPGQPVYTALCRHEASAFLEATRQAEPLLIACTQERKLFETLADQSDPPAIAPLKFVNIREMAAWSIEGGQAIPKIKALLAVAQLDDPEPVPVVDYKSEGKLLIIGPASKALPLAEMVGSAYAGQMQASVLVTKSDAPLPLLRNSPIHTGNKVSVKGFLGKFDVTWQQSNPIDLDICTQCQACVAVCPSGAIDASLQIDTNKCDRSGLCEKACEVVGAIRFDRLDQVREERFDMVLDTENEKIHTAIDSPPGYQHAVDLISGIRSLATLSQSVGEFEKPRYFKYNEKQCAHGRNGTKGCSQCIDVCSTQAITSVFKGGRGSIEVNPNLCMGCGACSTVCPSGAMRFAYPDADYTARHIRKLINTGRQAGAKDIELLLHSQSDIDGGTALLLKLGRLAASGKAKGLPARVFPVPLHHAASTGAELWLACLAYGASKVTILLTGEEAPNYKTALKNQILWVQGVLEALGLNPTRISLLATSEVDALDKALNNGVHRSSATKTPATFALGADKKSALEAAIEHLLKSSQSDQPALSLPAALPNGAPIGGLDINTEACTLCMSCVGACPQSALKDGGDMPVLSFIERNCVQCGLCVTTCPENALSLIPRLSAPEVRRESTVMHKAEPFGCIRCNKPFATDTMIKAMLAKIGGHSAFSGDALARLKMCSDCRVVDMMEKNV